MRLLSWRGGVSVFNSSLNFAKRSDAMADFVSHDAKVAITYIDYGDHSADACGQYKAALYGYGVQRIGCRWGVGVL